MAELNDPFSSLIHMGLTSYETKVYVTLINHGPKTAGELSLLSGVPRSKIYGALKSLEGANLIKTLHIKPLIFEADSPSVKLKPFIDRIESDTQRCVKAVEALALKYESLKHLYRTPYRGDINFIEIKGRRENIKHLNQMFENSSKKIRLALNKNAVVRIYKACTEKLNEARNRNVEIIVLTSKDVDRKIAEDLRDIVKLRKAEIRPPGLAAYIDSQKSLFITAVPDDVRIDRGEDIGLGMLHPHVVTLNETLFDFIFKKGET